MRRDRRDRAGGTMDDFLRVLGFGRPFMGAVLAAMVCMLGVSAFTGAFALVIKNVLDDVFINRNREVLRLIPGVILGIFLLKGAFQYGQDYLMAYAGQGLIRDLRGAVFDHLQWLGPRFYGANPTGTLVSRILNDVAMLREMINKTFTSLLSDSITLVVLLGVVVYRDWQLALISLCVAPVTIWPIAYFGRRMKRISRVSQETVAELTSSLNEAIIGHRVVQSFTAEDREQQRFAAHNKRYFRKMMKKAQARALTSPVIELIVACGAAAGVYYGGSRVIDGTMTTGTFFSFLTALIMAYQPMRKLGSVHIAIQEGMAAARRVFSVLDEVPEIADRPDAQTMTPFADRIEFRGVHFRYGEEWGLRDVSLVARAGETVAFVGPSGAGKTTLVHLIPRFYEVDDGAITIDGVDIRDLTLASLRRQVAVVGQDTFLFDATVRDNIAYGRPGASAAEVEAAARAANAHHFVCGLPAGYDTEIGEGGVRLSGGQKQRLSIARALLKDAPILILDEATSALDTESEALVQEALNRLMEARTTLVIAHRLSTVQQANRIYVLDHGQVVESGSHAELLERGGLYRHLYDIQFGEERDGG
ncbi:MAG TPA: lipid A export permease/ATP-binding protein MsbA [bacterium]